MIKRAALLLTLALTLLSCNTAPVNQVHHYDLLIEDGMVYDGLGRGTL